jgi:hypothetical protein
MARIYAGRLQLKASPSREMLLLISVLRFWPCLESSIASGLELTFIAIERVSNLLSLETIELLQASQSLRKITNVYLRHR